MLRLFVSTICFAVISITASADTAMEVYKGKTISLFIGNSIGGGYDLYARTLARHLPKFITGNPTIIPKNMEGGGSLRAANYMYDVAPRDGTAIATIGRGTAFAPLIGQPGAKFHGPSFSWIGSANDETSACAAWHTSGVANFNELRLSDLILGTTLATDDATQLPKLLNGLFGTRFKLVMGYPGGNEMNMAMERGETQGRCGLSWGSYKATHPEWVEKKLLKILFQVSFSKHPDLPDVPLLMDLAETQEQKQMLSAFAARQVMGRPFFAPPGLPVEVLNILRDAFDATMKDNEFLADSVRTGLEINPVSGDRIQKLVADIYQTPTDVVQKMIRLSQ